VSEVFTPPFPWFGGKSRVAGLIWERLGDVGHYVEPFFGAGATLLARPHAPNLETANDRDGFVCNVFRALQHDPAGVLAWCQSLQHECDLHARHAWLVEHRDSLTSRLEGDPEYYDVRIAGWWLWGISLWIGSGWCAGTGSWVRAAQEDGSWQLVKQAEGGDRGINRQRLHMSDGGQGVDRRLLHMSNGGRGINRQRLHMSNGGQGVNRQLLHVGDGGQGINRKRLHMEGGGQGVLRSGETLEDYIWRLHRRLSRVRFACGDWLRIVTPAVLSAATMTGIMLDPPYSHIERDADLYAVDEDISAQVRDWAIANGDDPRLRIALCGYDGEHAMPESWETVSWHTPGGLSRSGTQAYANRQRERLWFSPHCLTPTKQLPLL